MIDDAQFLWATPLFQGHISEELRRDTNDLVLDHYNKSTKDKDPSWTSNDNLQTLSQFDPLMEQLLKFSRECLNSLTIEFNKCYIPCMWANVAPVGVAHQTHNHPNCLFSGVLYLQTPEGCAGTVFTDPRPASKVLRPSYNDPSVNVLGQDFFSSPSEGKMVLFPGWLEHGVLNVPYNANEQRITLSWNIMIKGDMGQYTARLKVS